MLIRLLEEGDLKERIQLKYDFNSPTRNDTNNKRKVAMNIGMYESNLLHVESKKEEKGLETIQSFYA